MEGADEKFLRKGAVDVWSPACANCDNAGGDRRTFRSVECGAAGLLVRQPSQVDVEVDARRSDRPVSAVRVPAFVPSNGEPIDLLLRRARQAGR